MAKNPYEILDISKSANDAEIKSAYRKLAKKYHPDLNPGNKEADKRFKELNSANDILSDKDKRAAYDRGEVDGDGQPKHQQQQRYYRDFAEGQHGRRYQTDSASFDWSDLESLFGGLGGMGNMNKNSNGTHASSDVRYDIDVTFMEAARGAKKRVTMPDGKAMDIIIPEGIDENQQLRLKGQGKPASKNHPAGDAYVLVHIRPHAFFVREGKNITVEVPIALHESVLGGKINIPTIHGAVDMNVPSGAGSGTTLRLKGKGVKGGDQLVKLKLAMPKEIDAELHDAIRKWSETHSYNPRKFMEAAE